MSQEEIPLENDPLPLQDADVARFRFGDVESDEDTSDTDETRGNPDGDDPKAGPSKPATRSRTKAKEALLTQTNPHKGSQTGRKTQKRPRSPKDPRQLPLTGEPPQKVATISATRAEQLEDLIRALGQNQAATNAMLGRIERGQDLILAALQDLTPRITVLEARTQALQEARKEGFVQTIAGPSIPPQPEAHTQSHRKDQELSASFD